MNFRRLICHFPYAVFSLLCCVATCTATVPYLNPVLPYDYSDPDVCRVGDTYLLTSSSFNNVPGLQILTSRDLVHWEVRDAAIRYRLPGFREGDKVLGNFVWAPSIRVHDGRLYIFYGDPDRGIYCIRSRAIDEHVSPLDFPIEWEEPVLVIPGIGFIDPCPLWDDDGRVWLCHGVAGSRYGLKSVLMMAELTPDALGLKTPSRIIFDGHAEHPTCEGPKLYKRHGYYYIMHPAGGVKQGWQVVQRSRSIYGPYQLKVTLSQGSTAVNGPHQGAWVETPEGEHWFLHFQDVGAAGRIVHLQPMRWVDDWPVMGSNGEPVSGYRISDKGTENETSDIIHHTFTDDFDQGELSLTWQWPGGYVNPRWFFCDAANSLLRLYSAPRNEELMPNMLLCKIPAMAFTATARVRFAPNRHKKMQGAEQAGMIVFGRQSFVVNVPVEDSWCYLRLVMDDRQRGQFYTSADGDSWTKSGTSFQAVAGHWTGAQLGFFCTRDDRPFNDAGWLDIDWFEINEQ